MKMNIVKWDEGMAARCIERVARGYVPAYVHHDNSLNRAFQSGEWEEFKSKIDKTLKKNARSQG